MLVRSEERLRVTTALRTAALASDAYAPAQPWFQLEHFPPHCLAVMIMIDIEDHLLRCWGRHALLAAVDEAIRLGLTEEAQAGQARLRKMAYQ